MTQASRHSVWKTTHSAGDSVSDEYEAVYEETLAADELAQMVYDRRTELGLTQAQLAERAGMKQPAISRIEGGGTTPTVPLLRRLAKALDANLTIEFTPHHGAVAPEAAEDVMPKSPAVLQALQEILETPRTAPPQFKALAQYILLVLEPSAHGESTGPRWDDWVAGLTSTRPPAAADPLKVHGFSVDRGHLRPAGDRNTTTRLLLLALSEELGLARRKDWQKQLPLRVEQLLEDCSS